MIVCPSCVSAAMPKTGPVNCCVCGHPLIDPEFEAQGNGAQTHAGAGSEDHGEPVGSDDGEEDTELWTETEGGQPVGSDGNPITF